MIKRYRESVKKIFYVFDKKQKRTIFCLLIVIIIGALFELLGVTAVLPFITLALSPNALNKNAKLGMLYNMLHMSSPTVFLAVLAGILIMIYVVKNSYLVFMNHSIYKFTYNNQRKLANRLLKCYMDQPYSFFLNQCCADSEHRN